MTSQMYAQTVLYSVMLDFFRTVGFRTCCRQRAPWFSFPPEKPGAAQEPPGDCWEPAGERDCSRSQ